jgi:SAM-dependent methyltransferase
MVQQCPVPVLPPLVSEIGQQRLQGMRGRKGFWGDRLHAFGVGLGLRYGGSFFYPSEDRQILECIIFPHYQLSPLHRNIVFVGNDWYTQGYGRIFGLKNFTTIDANPAKARYGSARNIVDYASNLDKHVGVGSIDLVFLNGVIGWGLNDPGEAEATFDCLGRCLRPGGHLIVGWNDIPEHKPFEFTALKTLKAFNPMTFEPLSAQEFLVANEWRHTFSFFERAFLPSSGA